MEADENVANKKRNERECESKAAVLQQRAREERHGAKGSEVPRMRSNAQAGGEHNQGDREQSAIEQARSVNGVFVH